MESIKLTMDNIYLALPLFNIPPMHDYTNAVIVAIDHDNEIITVVTDFGNELNFSIESLAYRYTSSETYLCDNPIPVESIELRLTTQIRNLKEKLDKYRHVIGTSPRLTEMSKS